MRAGAGDGPYPLPWRRLAQKGDELLDILRKRIDVRGPFEGKRRHLVAAGRAAKPKIDPAREERLECAKLLGDHERRVIREHDPAGADPDRRSSGGDVSDDDRSRRARHRRHVVVLGEPIAVIAPPLCMLGQVEAVPERLGGSAALDDRGEIEDGKGRHVY